MAYKLIGKNTLIPRITCKARRRKLEKVEDSDSPFLNDDLQVVYEEFELKDCVVQPMTGRTARDFTTFSPLLQVAGQLFLFSRAATLASSSARRWSTLSL